MNLGTVKANLATYDAGRGLRRRVWPRPEVQLLREFLQAKNGLDDSVDIAFQDFQDFCSRRGVSLDAILQSNANAAEIIFKPWRNSLVIRPLNFANIVAEFNLPDYSAVVIEPLDYARIAVVREREMQQQLTRRIQQLEQTPDYLSRIPSLANLPERFFQPADYEAYFHPPQSEPQPSWPEPNMTAQAAPAA